MSLRAAIHLGAALLVAVLAVTMLRAPARVSSSVQPRPNDAALIENRSTDNVAPAVSADTTAVPSIKGPVSSAIPDTQSETAMMAELRATLGRGTPQATLDLARELERIYPDGAEAEERSLYTVDALIALNRISEMRDEARRHLAKWPGSPISARVEARTGVHPDPRPLQ